MHCPTGRSVGGVVLLAVLCAGLAGPTAARAYTPDHPDVQAMVARGVAFLKKARLPSELGGACLVALAVHKSGKARAGNEPQSDTADRVVVEAVVRCRRACEQFPEKPLEDKDVYNLGCALIFLAELDADQYRPEMKILLDQLLRRQRKDGSWSYPPRVHGDTSITQYGVLGLWAAQKAGLHVDKEAVDACANWLIRTQDPTGAWSYIGVDPGNFNRIDQREDFEAYHAVTGRVTPSLVVAALGSLYIAADMMGYKDSGRRLMVEKKLLSVIKLVRTAMDTDATAGRIFGRTVPEGEHYYRDHCRIKTERWQYYYLYGIERYESFRAVVLGIEDDEPQWYDQGVEFMKRAQRQDGSWTAAPGGGPFVNTAFGILFLLRSNKQKPPIVETLSSRQGFTEFETTIDDIINRISEKDRLKRIAALLKVKIRVAEKGDRAAKEELAVLLRTLAEDEWHEVRLLAVRLVTKLGELDYLPALIFALSDPDRRVVKKARDGLRAISRRLKGFGLDDFSVNHPTTEERNSAQEQWKRWYLSVRPDRAGEFEDG